MDKESGTGRHGGSEQVDMETLNRWTGKGTGRHEGRNKWTWKHGTCAQGREQVDMKAGNR